MAAVRTPRYIFFPARAAGMLRIRKTPDPIDSYLDRTGYVPSFIDEARQDLHVPLPTLLAVAKSSAQTFQWKGKTTYVLDYTHFSTIQSKTRKLPILSAVNIDGKALQKKTTSHKTWRPDPRIPTSIQLVDGVYGTQKNGFFSRGHMTRGLDPGWGPPALANRADEDTYHATNAAPQVQSFNDGVWGEIEDYILENTRSTRRICVFTGPVLRNGDPLIHGVKVPLQFWKVVAFLHPATSELAATGYVSSQATEVAGLLVSTVFGDVENTQRPIAAIEKLAGIRFAKLKAADVLRGASPSFATRLRDVRDIMLE